MELEVRLNGRSLDISITDPYRPDLPGIMDRIVSFLGAGGIGPREYDLAGLLPLMIRGVVGCEEGCPANAKDLVERGFRNFTLQYVEGGILAATARTNAGGDLVVKLFPEF